ncbi:rod shape-determining protein MreD [Candidatus Macondimonas diazotrophica]|jgi:rod shape-determining protein MreD|uniref:Rod shape-determining protein MreD n=1 Tax=Candidatus Macondimonas diazotrophica TaxID=2305248 RepID=A0A4Z0FAC4_9GAMM|nr:rod shape-determining protein MreD [Candidatus Macondimonas diazotrophica]MDY6956994.1 rod shape-determining protein MreD [Pseudomonadota bacterium]HBG29650.1 rod shape-determining protein MreD [Gammaproteobacteria bacterium]NCU01504.1 rod shape-determining protein MreD [Candidatus Macondimonas diazotrophica]TFZ83100.1 rod shape-determining protein MreD [Candidatus Macondimonas diazotrophica]HBG50427.1 rod shape-determining protein MreD [Gammaproteobacteria bacterium]
MPARWGILGVCFFVSLALTFVPLPPWAADWRPHWVALVLAYWIIALPERVSLTTAWCLGLLIDAGRGGTLGVQALSLTLMAYPLARFHLQLRAFPVWQQALLLLPLLSIAVFPGFWLAGMGNRSEPSFPWQGILTSCLLWPWVFAVLRHVRRRFSLA